MNNFTQTLFTDSHCTYQETASWGSSSGVYAVQYRYHSSASERQLSLIWNNDFIKISDSSMTNYGFSGVTGTTPNPWIYSYPTGDASELGGLEWYFQPTYLINTVVEGDYTYYNWAFKYCHPRILPYYRNTLQIEDGQDSDYNDFILYMLPESDAYFTGPDDYMSSDNSGAPTTVVRDGSGSNPPTYNINWGSGATNGAPTMSLFSGWGMRVNKPGVIKLRFQREADYCIRVIPFKLGTYDHQPLMVVYTYDNKIEDFSFNVPEEVWGTEDESHIYYINLQKGLGTSNESCTGSGNATCDQCNAYGVEQISGTWKWGALQSSSRIRVRSTPIEDIPATNFP